ncbi:Ankyrin repeat protein 1 [Giardia muris]|uniref:Ankyrin repeat protein 1 n=1 Tax=Giardia muris TaxID=5742 RepID=A0A4Z1T8N1_GIAMU|nr:Ankyrin repeat protein 1 [Giardia muris]|eukprot:TNJ28871.1 Ankyrin repeat protein 1 [Giardia muris]
MDPWFRALQMQDYEYLSDHPNCAGARNHEGLTALQLAARAGDLAAARVLVSREAGMATEDGETALLIAARQNQGPMCDLLAPYEGKVHMRDGRNALMVAAERGCLDAVNALQGYFGIERDICGSSELDYAILSESVECVKALLRARAYSSEDLKIALHLVRQRRNPALQSLLEVACIERNNASNQAPPTRPATTPLRETSRRGNTSAPTPGIRASRVYSTESAMPTVFENSGNSLMLSTVAGQSMDGSMAATSRLGASRGPIVIRQSTGGVVVVPTARRQSLGASHVGVSGVQTDAQIQESIGKMRKHVDQAYRETDSVLMSTSTLRSSRQLGSLAKSSVGASGLNDARRMFASRYGSDLVSLSVAERYMKIDRSLTKLPPAKGFSSGLELKYVQLNTRQEDSKKPEHEPVVDASQPVTASAPVPAEASPTQGEESVPVTSVNPPPEASSKPLPDALQGIETSVVVPINDSEQAAGAVDSSAVDVSTSGLAKSARLQKNLHELHESCAMIKSSLRTNDVLNRISRLSTVIPRIDTLPQGRTTPRKEADPAVDLKRADNDQVEEMMDKLSNTYQGIIYDSAIKQDTPQAGREAYKGMIEERVSMTKKLEQERSSRPVSASDTRRSNATILGMTVQASTAAPTLAPSTPEQIPEGSTPLINAALARNLALCRKNLSDVRKVDASGRTALMHAAKIGFIEGIHLLAGHECGIHDKSGLTALMLAAMNGKSEVVLFLRTFEARLKDNMGRTALYYALEAGNLVAAEMLREAEGINIGTLATKGTRTALMEAAMSGNIVHVFCLLPFQSRLQDPQGKTALMYAVERSRLSCVQLLAPHEAGITTLATHPDGEGFCALMEAIRRGNRELVEILLPYEYACECNGRRPQSYATTSSLRDYISKYFV